MISRDKHEREHVENDGEPRDAYGMSMTTRMSVGGYFPGAISRRLSLHEPTPTVPAQCRGISGVPWLHPDGVVGEPVLWTWAIDDLGGRGVRGVTDTPGRACRALLAVLRGMPDHDQGTIRPARLDLLAYPYPCYRYGPILVRVHRDQDSGRIVFDHGEGQCR